MLLAYSQPTDWLAKTETEMGERYSIWVVKISTGFSRKLLSPQIETIRSYKNFRISTPGVDANAINKATWTFYSDKQIKKSNRMIETKRDKVQINYIKSNQISVSQIKTS